MVFAIGALYLVPLLWIPLILYMGFISRQHLLPSYRDSLYIRVFFVFVISAMISGLLSWNWKTIIGTLTIPCFYVLTVFVVQYFNSRERVMRVLTLAFYFAVVSALIGIIWEIFGISKDVTPVKFIFGVCDMFENPKNVSRLLGTFFNANVAATFFAAMFFVGVYMLPKLKGRDIWLFTAGEAIIIIAFLLTESRAGLLGLFLGLIFYFVCKRNRIFTVFAITIGVVWLILLLAAPDMIARGGEILVSDMDTRWRIWNDGIKQFLAKPIFGWGFSGAFFYEGDAYKFMNVAHPHNIFLTALCFYGIVGLIICCVIEIVKIRVIIDLIRKKEDLAPLFLAISAVFWGQGLFDCTIVSPQAGVLYFGCSALVIAVSKWSSSSEVEEVEQESSA